MKAQPIKADTRKSTFLLKKYLLEKFNIKTSIRSEFYSMGCSLNISYDLGPDSDIVANVCKKLEYGRFDGMTDYSYSVDVEGIVIDVYQLEEFKHVTIRQDITHEFELKLCQFMFEKIKIGNLLPPTDWEEYISYNIEVNNYLQGCGSLSNLFYRYFQTRNFATQDEEKINILECHFSEKTNGNIYFIYEFEGNKYNTEDEPIIYKKETKSTNEPIFDKIEVTKGEVQIIEYSDKSIAIIGDTKPIKDKLKGLGGKFNFRLSCGPGWIFPKTSLEKIQNELSCDNPEPTDPERTPTKKEGANIAEMGNIKMLMPPNLQSETESKAFTINKTDKGVEYTLNCIPGGNYKGKLMQIAFWGTWSDGLNDRLSIRYGKKSKWNGLFWVGGGDGKVYLQSLHGGSYRDVEIEYSLFSEILKEIGANNELKNFNEAVEAWTQSKPESKETTLRNEIEKTIHFLESTDMKLYGEVSEGVKRAAEIQSVILQGEESKFNPPQIKLPITSQSETQLILF